MPSKKDLIQLYDEQIRPLPSEDRLRLLATIARELARESEGVAPARRSLLDLEGLGADIWRDVDAQAYIDELRREWDRPS